MTELSQTRKAVRDYTKRGMTPRDISILLNISTQRVYHHLKKLDMKPAKQKIGQQRRVS